MRWKPPAFAGAGWQDVDQEAADELVDGEPDDLVSVGSVGAVILPFEGYAGLVEGEQPAVGDGDAVGVARQRGQHRLGSAALRRELRRALAVDDPFGLAQRRQIGSEGMALGEVGMIAEELQAAGVVGSDQLCQEQASKRASKARGPVGRSRAGRRSTARHRERCRRPARSRHDNVDVRVMGER
jgi:hypothetical protein